MSILVNANDFFHPYISKSGQIMSLKTMSSGVTPYLDFKVGNSTEENSLVKVMLLTFLSQKYFLGKEP